MTSQWFKLWHLFSLFWSSFDGLSCPCLLFSSFVEISVPFNPKLRVGNTIEIQLPMTEDPNKTTDRRTVGDDSTPDASGKYLISELKHLFFPSGDVWLHLTDTVLKGYIINTFCLVFGVGCLGFVLGGSTAWICATCHFPGRSIFEWALLLQLAVTTYYICLLYKSDAAEE